MKKTAWMLSIGILLFSPYLYSWQTTLLVEAGGGWLHGYTQIPRGGDFATTSYHRPSFNELGLSHDPFLHIETELSHGHGFIFCDYFRFTPHEDSTLSQDLRSHSFLIPAGTPLDVRVHYNWYQTGIGFNTLHYFKTWQLQPTLAANIVKFNYCFWAPVAKSRRYLDLVVPTFGLKAQHTLSTKWELEIGGETSTPMGRLTLANAEIGLNYTLASTRYGSFSPRMMLGIIHIDYQDQQKIPNHFRYKLAPYLSFGIRMNSHRHVTG